MITCATGMAAMSFGPNGDGRQAGTRLPIVLYSRAGCSLCAELEQAILGSGYAPALDLVVVDVDADAELCARYGTRVPVLSIDGREALEGRVTVPDLRRVLARALR